MREPDVVTIPDAIRLGGWLGGALQWHFTFAWLFAATGIVYVSYLAASGHWRHVVLRFDEVPGVWPMVRHYVGLGAEPTLREAYNPLQKLAYSSTLFLGALAVATGVLLAKPVQCAPIVDALGGYAAIRMYHFAIQAWSHLSPAIWRWSCSTAGATSRRWSRGAPHT